MTLEQFHALKPGDRVEVGNDILTVLTSADAKSWGVYCSHENPNMRQYIYHESVEEYTLLDPATPPQPEPLRFVSFTSVLVPAGPNNGDFILHTALDREGRLWQSYESTGYSNVPTGGLWRLVPLNIYKEGETP